MRAVTESRPGGPGGRGGCEAEPRNTPTERPCGKGNGWGTGLSMSKSRRHGRAMGSRRRLDTRDSEDGGGCVGNAAYWTGRTGTFKKWGSSFEKA